MIPEVVLTLLSGGRRLGEAEPMFPLLTVDPDGFPRVCMLSRGELWPAEGDLIAVVAARRASANLERARQATLLVIDQERLYYARLVLVDARREKSGVLVGRLAAESVEQDSAGVALSPMTFTSTEQLAAREHTQESRDLVTTFLRDRQAPPHTD